MQRMTILAAGLVCLAAAACGGGSNGPCDPAANTGCDNGQVCENVQGGTPACFAPVLLRGDVIDLGDQSAISGARVVALDVSRAAVSDVDTSDSAGKYELRIPATRDSSGNPMGIQVSLRADAAGYQSFPGGVRTAIPIDTSAAVKDSDGNWVLDGTQTEVGLFALPSGAGTGSITGHVDLDPGVGAIVVADLSATTVVGYDAVVDRSGNFSILNLPAGDYTVRAYAPGEVHKPVSVTLAAGGTKDVSIVRDTASTGSIAGSIQIVNGGGASSTSVVVFVESTFDANLMRGAAPPGLEADGVTGAFTIDHMPPGKYVVLAAFPDDGLVRDPDTCIAGTEIVHVTVADQPVTLSSSFKVTGALAMIAPTEGASVANGMPTFIWQDDSGEDEYQIDVYDSFGQNVWSKTIPGVSGSNPQATYDGANPLPGGMYYQVHVTSLKNSCELAASEDLAGVFYVP